jgi:hypothetical protein
LLAGAAIFSLALGARGFIRYHQPLADGYTTLDGLYQSVQLFTLESVEAAPLGPMPWELQLARFLSPLVAAYAVIQALALVFGAQIERLAMRLTRNHVVIVGLGRKGDLLVKAYRAQGRAVTVVELDAANARLDAARELGARVLVGDGRDPRVLRQVGLARAAALVSVCGADADNAEVALQAQRLACADPRAELRALAHLYDRQLWALLRERELSSRDGGHFYLEYFNIFDSGARILLDDAGLPAGEQPGVLVVGLGHLGESVLVHAAYRCYPAFRARGERLRVRVVDLEAAGRLAEITRRCPLVAAVCAFEPFAVDTRSPEFAQGGYFFEGQRQVVSHAYICLDDPTAAVSAGLALLDQARGCPVVISVRMSAESGLAGLLWDAGVGAGGPARASAFDLLGRTCQPHLLEDGTHETLARAIHATYLEDMRAAGAVYDPQLRPALLPWEQLPERYRLSNLHQAEHIGLKLRAVGASIAAWTQPGAEQLALSDVQVETMAALEQERFRAEREAWGWHYARERDDANRRHPAVLGWDDPRLAEAERDKTRAAVRRIPYLLSLAGFQVVFKK